MRAQRLLAEGRERLMSDADIARFLALGDQHPEFRAVFDRWQAFNRAVLEMARDAGLLTQAQLDLFTQHGDYIPFYRLFEDEGGEHTPSAIPADACCLPSRGRCAAGKRACLSSRDSNFETFPVLVDKMLA
ncbi:MAG: hypothetical protein U1E38_07085 [Rhodospirillales bacterium]